VTLTEILCLAAGLLLLAMFVNALRKATGLLLVILGILTCMTGIGMIVGVPLIFVGGILLFL
jgi:hypothetical protein